MPNRAAARLTLFRKAADYGKKGGKKGDASIFIFKVAQYCEAASVADCHLSHRRGGDSAAQGRWRPLSEYATEPVGVPLRPADKRSGFRRPKEGGLTTGVQLPCRVVNDGCGRAPVEVGWNGSRTCVAADRPRQQATAEGTRATARPAAELRSFDNNRRRDAAGSHHASARHDRAASPTAPKSTNRQGTPGCNTMGAWPAPHHNQSNWPRLAAADQSPYDWREHSGSLAVSSIGTCTVSRAGRSTAAGPMPAWTS